MIVFRNTIRFDWTAPRRLIAEIDELAQEAKQWIPDLTERMSLLKVLFDLATQVHTMIAGENQRCKRDQNESVPQSDQVTKDIDLIEPQITVARQRFLRDAQRAAQVRYAKGMAIGAALLGVVSGILGIGFLLSGVWAVNGVGLLAGGVGACVSVLQRMTSGTMG